MNRKRVRTRKLRKNARVGARRPAAAVAMVRRVPARAVVRRSKPPDAYTDITSVVTREFSRPIVVLSVIVAVAACVGLGEISGSKAHVQLSSKHVGTLTGALHADIVTWLGTNFEKLLEMVMVAPAIIDLPPSIRPQIAVTSAIWYLAMPVFRWYDVVIQAVLLVAYFRVRSNSTKFVIIAIGAIVMLLMKPFSYSG